MLGYTYLTLVGRVEAQRFYVRDLQPYTLFQLHGCRNGPPVHGVGSIAATHASFLFHHCRVIWSSTVAAVVSRHM